jgi:hypothetical protein
MGNRFLGICILISSVLIAAAVVVAGSMSRAVAPESQIGRYQFHPSTPPGVIWILDTTTGKVTTQNG